MFFGLHNLFRALFHLCTPFFFNKNIRYSSMKSDLQQWGSNSEPSDFVLKNLGFVIQFQEIVQCLFDIVHK